MENTSEASASLRDVHADVNTTIGEIIGNAPKRIFPKTYILQEEDGRIWLHPKDIPKTIAQCDAIVEFAIRLRSQLSTQEHLDVFHAKVEALLHKNERGSCAARRRDYHPSYRKGFVYLMRNSRNGLVKIGFSKDPKVRERTLQSEEPEIEMIWCVSGNRDKEEALHHQYRRCRVRGEWFKLSEAAINRIRKSK